MTDEDLIRVFNYIGFFKGVLRWTGGQGSVKLITCNSLRICNLKVKGAKNVKSRIAYKKWDKK